MSLMSLTAVELGKKIKAKILLKIKMLFKFYADVAQTDRAILS